MDSLLAILAVLAMLAGVFGLAIFYALVEAYFTDPNDWH